MGGTANVADLTGSPDYPASCPAVYADRDPRRVQLAREGDGAHEGAITSLVVGTIGCN